MSRSLVNLSFGSEVTTVASASNATPPKTYDDLIVVISPIVVFMRTPLMNEMKHTIAKGHTDPIEISTSVIT